MILSPSLLSADVGNLAAELSALEAAGLRWVHWDVSGRAVCAEHHLRVARHQAVAQAQRPVFDVHLMIVEPETIFRIAPQVPTCWSCMPRLPGICSVRSRKSGVWA
ncbi:MAG: hypothetical protein ACLSAH_20790 [Bilophila wadsworthia]